MSEQTASSRGPARLHSMKPGLSLIAAALLSAPVGAQPAGIRNARIIPAPAVSGGLSHRIRQLNLVFPGPMDRLVRPAPGPTPADVLLRRPRSLAGRHR